MSAYRFNPPPNWPSPPVGWVPPPGWRPDPAWPAMPAGWELWVPGEMDPADLEIHNAWWSGSRADHPAEAETIATPPSGVFGPDTLPGLQIRAFGADTLAAAAVPAGAFGAPAVIPPVPSAPPKVRVPSETLVVAVPAVAVSAAAPPLSGATSEVEQLREWIARTQGMDALQAQDALRQMREQVTEAHAAALSDAEAIRKVARDEARQRQDEARSAEEVAEHAHAEADQSQEEIARAQSELAALRARVVIAEESALLQEAGVYAFHSPLKDAVACRAELDEAQAGIKTLVTGGKALEDGGEWTPEGTAAEGRRLSREVAKLMLRAYNAEAENSVLTARPHRADALAERLGKCRETIEKAGAPMGLRIADAYHHARVRELRLACDLAGLKEDEKEAERALRAREREEATARKELDRELERLRKEEQRCRTAADKARKHDDADATQKAEAALAEATERLEEAAGRSADMRAGHLYVISNIGAFGPGVVRVGVTRRPDPLEEIGELSGAGVPFSFDVHAVVRSEDATGLEERLRERFAGSRVNTVDETRGFYRVPPAEVRDALKELAGDALIDFVEEPEALEWRAGVEPLA